MITTDDIVVREDHRVIMDRLVEMLHVFDGTTLTILLDQLHMRRVSTRWRLSMLTPEQKEVR